MLVPFPSPNPSKKMDYEKVNIDEWISGEIEEVQARLNKEKKFTDRKTGESGIREAEEVRFKFKLDGYEYAHYSRWNTKSLNDKSNLVKKYLRNLIPDLNPQEAVDLSVLNGMRVKTMWDEQLFNGNMYQFIANIKRLVKEESKELEIDEKEEGKDFKLEEKKDDEEIKLDDTTPF